MKGKIAAFVFLLSFNAFAKPVFLYPICNHRGSAGECSFHNNSGELVNCHLQIIGYTKNGSMVNAFQFAALYPGMTSWIRINAKNPQTDPLRMVTGNAVCNTR